MRSSTISRPAGRRAAQAAVVASAVGALLVAGALPASAEDAIPSARSIDFSAPGYTLGDGSPAGQEGWTGSTSTFDAALVTAADVPDAGLADGAVGLRFSNAVVTGAINQLASPRVVPAGEPGTGASADTFDASFTVASATGGLQPGLDVEVDADTDGSRAGGGVVLHHVTTGDQQGLQVGTFWPVTDGGDEIDDWASRSVVVDATVPHTIRYVVHFLADAPDVAHVYVDGELALTSGSWEVFHDGTGAGLQTVDGLLVRGSTSVPTTDGVGFDHVEPTAEQQAALDGEGLVLTDLSLSSYEQARTALAVAAPDHAYGTAATAQVSATATDGQPLAGTADVTIDGADAGTATLADGHASVVLPTDLAVGQHTVTVSWPGDEHHAGAQGTTSFTVAPGAAHLSVDLSRSSVAAGAAAPVATVAVRTPGVAPAGDVVLTSGAFSGPVRATVGADGRATATLPRLTTPGSFDLVATYGTGADAVSVTAPVVVTSTPSRTKVRLKHAKKVRKGKKRAAVRIVVTTPHSSLTARGKVEVRVDGTKVDKARLGHAGKVTVRLPWLAKGKHHVVVDYAGKGAVTGSSGARAVKVSKSTKKTRKAATGKHHGSTKHHKGSR